MIDRVSQDDVAVPIYCDSTGIVELNSTAVHPSMGGALVVVATTAAAAIVDTVLRVVIRRFVLVIMTMEVVGICVH
jgi:hypothetical protein